MLLRRLLPLLLPLLWGCTAPDSNVLNRVRSANRLAATAEAAYAAGRPNAAIAAYERLAALGPLPDEARLTLGHAYFRVGRRSEARACYAPLSTSTTTAHRAVALQQLGLLAAAEQEYDRALPLLRAALRADPTSPVRRRNYETLARWLASATPPEAPRPRLGGGDRPPPPPPGATAGQPRPAGGPGSPGNAPQGQGRQPGGGERATDGAGRRTEMAHGSQPGTQRGFDTRTTTPDGPGPAGGANGGVTAVDPAAAARTQTHRAPPPPTDISAAQARMLLEAMQAAETQYLQQLPRPAAPAATPDRPDW